MRKQHSIASADVKVDAMLSAPTLLTLRCLGALALVLCVSVGCTLGAFFILMGMYLLEALLV